MKLGRNWPVHLSDKPVTPSRQRLDKPRRISGVAQGIAESQDCVIETHIKVYKSIRRPKLIAKLVPGHDFAGLFQQHNENLKGLFLQPESDAVLMQLARRKVNLKGSEAENRSRIAGHVQRPPNCKQASTFIALSNRREKVTAVG